MTVFLKTFSKWFAPGALSRVSVSDFRETLFRLLRWNSPALLVVAALAFQEHFRSLIGGKIFIILYPAIFFGALYSGLWPGIFAAVIAILGVWYLFVSDRYTFGIDDVGDAFGLIVFAFTSLLANVLGARARSSHVLAEAARKKLAAANETLARQAEIIASSNDAILGKALDGTITSWNDGAERLYGYSASEMIGRSIDLVVPEDRKAHEKDILEKVCRGERVDHYETARVRKDGGRIDVSVTVSPMRDPNGKIFGVSKIARDITEMKSAQRLLKQKTIDLEVLNQNLEAMVTDRTRNLESEVARRTEAVEKLHLAQQAAHIGTFDLNLETGINTWTPELELMYGLAPGSFLKTRAAWESLVHPEDRDRLTSALNLALETGQPVEAEWRVIRADGSIRWLTARFQVFKDKTGRPGQLIGVNIDITRRKEAELALKDLSENLERRIRERTLALEERDEKLKFTLNSAQAGTWDWDMETNAVEWDGAMFTMFGVSRETFKPTYPAFLQLVHPEDRERTNQKVLDAVKENRDFEAEYRVVWPDQSIHHLLARGKSYRGSGGRPSHMLGICWDVSQRKQEELARLNAEQKFRVVMEAAPDAILLLNASGEILSVNAQGEQLFGYSRSELNGQLVEVLIPKEARQKHVSLREQFLTSPETRPMAKGRELHAVSKDGRLIPVEISLSPAKAGDEFFVMAVVRNITERKLAEAQLRTLAAVAESSGDFIGVCNPDMSPYYLNEAGMRMVGLGSMEEVKQTRLLDYFWPDDRPMVEHEAIPMLTKTGRWSGICRFRNFKTGEPIHTLWNAFVIRDASGKPTAWGTVSPNLNQVKASEDKIRMALAEKEVLLREIHHRVKNNLNIISSLLELQAMGIHDHGIRDMFVESQNRVMSMALIHEKLYQSKNLARLDFANYINDLVLYIYHSYGRDPAAIRPEIDIGKVDLDIDTAIPCSLIINELVSNSLKHAFPDQKTGRVLVSLQQVKESNGYELEVADDGIGFSSDAHSEESRSLGLKLVRSLTHQLRGTLLQNGSEKGASFRIRFTASRTEGTAYADANFDSRG